MEETKDVATVPQQTQVQLFGTDKSAGIITKAREVANALAPIVDTLKLFNMISGRKHVRAEGWTTMIAMLGVFPQTEYARKTADSPLTYEARILLKTMDGKVVGAGEAICSAAERNWAGRDEYAIKSMAQTRAVGKACRLSFSWIMALAGYDPLPLEEVTDEMREKGRQVSMPKPVATQAVDAEEDNTDPPDEEPRSKAPIAGAISKAQIGLIMAKLGQKFPKNADKEAVLKAKLTFDFPETGGDLTRLHWKKMDAMLKWIESLEHGG